MHNPAQTRYAEATRNELGSAGETAGMLKRFANDIWLADGPTVVAAAGFHYPTRMAIIRLARGKLFVWSPVALTKELRTEIDTLGAVRHIVAPNSLHHVYVGDWKAAYPKAILHAAPGLAAKRGDLAFDRELSDEADPAWAGRIDQAVMAGNRITTEVVFFHRPSGTVLFTDLLQQFPPRWFSGWRRVVAWLDRMIAAEPTVPRKFRLAFTDRGAARAGLSRILAWPIEKVVIAHGTPVESDGHALVKRAFRWLSA